MSDPSNERQSLQICGPEDTTLLFDPYENGYLWKIHNGSLHSIAELRLEIANACSFDAKKLAFREPIVFKVQWPVIKELLAGEVTTESVIFIRVEGDHLEFWNRRNSYQLSWPSGDPNTMRRWHLSMRVVGLSKEWPIDLDMLWILGTKTLELRNTNAIADQTHADEAVQPGDGPDLVPTANAASPGTAANDFHGTGPQAVEDPGSSDKPATAEVIKVSASDSPSEPKDQVILSPSILSSVIMGIPAIFTDPNFPPADIWREAESLIKDALKTYGFKGGEPEHVFWIDWLKRCGWDGRTNFLIESIQHCKTFAGQLLGEERHEDAAVFARVAVGLEKLKARADSCVKDLLAQARNPQRPIAMPQGSTEATPKETEEQRSARRRKIVDPWLKGAGITSPAMWAARAGGNMDKNTPRDYLNGIKKKLRDETATALAKPLGRSGDELPS